MQEHCVYADCQEDHTLLLTVFYLETPYVAKYSFAFNEKKLLFDFDVNVSLTLKNFSVSGFIV